LTSKDKVLLKEVVELLLLPRMELNKEKFILK